MQLVEEEKKWTGHLSRVVGTSLPEMCIVNHDASLEHMKDVELLVEH